MEHQMYKGDIMPKSWGYFRETLMMMYFFLILQCLYIWPLFLSYRHSFVI